jgi:hypothetical protein
MAGPSNGRSVGQLRAAGAHKAPAATTGRALANATRAADASLWTSVSPPEQPSHEHRIGRRDKGRPARLCASISQRDQRPTRFGAAPRITLAAAAILLETLVVKLRGYGMAGSVVVRCRQGHLFTTIWVPGASLKSLRLGWWRFQRCPVGKHWSLVSPVRESDLTEEERRTARENKDLRIP